MSETPHFDEEPLESYDAFEEALPPATEAVDNPDASFDQLLEELEASDPVPEPPPKPKKKKSKKSAKVASDPWAAAYVDKYTGCRFAPMKRKK